jgi:hypothetical protein
VLIRARPIPGSRLPTPYSDSTNMAPLKLRIPFSKRKESKPQEEDVILIPPPKLSRRLTLPLEQPRRVGIRRQRQQTAEQQECILFQLPFEIRELIWKSVLAGHCVARDLSGVRIGDCSDPWPPWEIPGGHRRGLRSFDWSPKGGNKLISLLLTCRRMFVLPFPCLWFE